MRMISLLLPVPQKMASSCGFCDEGCLRANLLEQLVTGVRDRAVARSILQSPPDNLDLENALDLCTTAMANNVEELDPLKASVKVEHDATSEGEENVDEVDLKEEEDYDDKSEMKGDFEDWDLVEEREERVWQRRRKRPNLKRDRSNVSRRCHLCGFPARTDVDLAAHGRELHAGERMFRSVGGP